MLLAEIVYHCTALLLDFIETMLAH